MSYPGRGREEEGKSPLIQRCLIQEEEGKSPLIQRCLIQGGAGRKRVSLLLYRGVLSSEGQGGRG